MFNIENKQNKNNNLSTNHEASINYENESEQNNKNLEVFFKDLLNNNSNKNNSKNSLSDIDSINNFKYCDSNLGDKSTNVLIKSKKDIKINKMTEICKENYTIETKENINNKDGQLIDENNFMSKKKMYLNFNVNSEECFKEDDEIRNLMICNNTTSSCETNSMSENEKRQALVKSEEFDKRLSESSQQNRMRLVFALLLRIVLPLANGVASRLKNFRTDKIWKMLRSFGSNKQTITNMLAYAANTISMGLSSVQVSHRIDPIIKIIKSKKAQIFERHGKNHITAGETSSSTRITWETQRIIYSPARHLSLAKIQPPELIETAEQCVNVKVLCEPPEGEPIRADIILIHGLHGSLPNTWKQGLWSNERMPVDFKRPPKPPLRPPKRPRYSRSNIFVPPHSNKKAKWAEHLNENISGYLNEKDDFNFILDQEDKENFIQFNGFSTESMQSKTSSSSADSTTYNLNTFSTFRLRLDDYDSIPPRPRSAKSRPKNAEPTAEDIFPFEQPYSRCWPGDWLPLDCPGVRVIAVNYTTDPHLWRPIWIKKHYRSSMSERVRVMTEHLINLKVGHNHPIVWVGHSKGGLFIKQILVDAWESGKSVCAPLWQSSRGVFFYSVPHCGSTLADINIPLVRRSIELIEIEKNSKVLLDLHRRFVNLYYSGYLKIEVFSFVETALTFMQVVYLRIVGVDSADPGIGDVCGLQLDHREICKPRSRKCILYTELVKMIKKVY